MLLFDNNINFRRHKDNVLPRINDVKTEIGKRNIHNFVCLRRWCFDKSNVNSTQVKETKGNGSPLRVTLLSFINSCEGNNLRVWQFVEEFHITGSKLRRMWNPQFLTIRWNWLLMWLGYLWVLIKLIILRIRLLKGLSRCLTNERKYFIQFLSEYSLVLLSMGNKGLTQMYHWQ